MDPQADNASGRRRIEGKRFSDRRFFSVLQSRAIRCIAVALFVSVVGCQTGPDASIELLESELRLYEDELFLQKRELDRLTAQIGSCRRYNAALKSELKNASNRGSSSSTGDSSRPAIPEDAIDDSDLQLPEIEFGDEELFEPAPSEVDTDTDTGGGVDDGVVTDPSELENGELDFDSAYRTNGNAPRITRIVLNKRLTGGYNDDGIRGSDGLSVVIEPQDDTGEYIALPGDVSIEAYSQQRGSSQRIGRWDFDATEVSAHMRESLFGKGIHLRLPWPVEHPESERIRLVVNFTGPNGDPLLVTKDLVLRTPSFEDFEVARDAAENDAAVELTADRPEWSPTRR